MQPLNLLASSSPLLVLRRQLVCTWSILLRAPTTFEDAAPLFAGKFGFPVSHHS